MKRQFMIPVEHREELAKLALESFVAEGEYELAKAQFRDLLEKKDWEEAGKQIKSKSDGVSRLHKANGALWDRIYEVVPGVPKEVVCGFSFSHITQDVEPRALGA